MGKTRKRKPFKKGGGLSPLSPGPKKSAKLSKGHRKKEGNLLVKVLLRETQKMYRKAGIKSVRSSPAKQNLAGLPKQHARRKSN